MPTSSFQTARTNRIVFSFDSEVVIRYAALAGSASEAEASSCSMHGLHLAASALAGNDDAVTQHPDPHPASRRWRDEAGATLALAWPLILANLTMALIQATDVLLMGRLGRAPAGRLGARAQPQFRLQPDLPRPRHRLLADDRDRARAALDQRSRGAAHLPPVAVADRHRHAADLADPVERRADHPRARPGPRRWRATPAIFLHGYMWSMLPFLLFQAMRNFVSALERPGWVLAISLDRDHPQRLARLGADLRPFRPPGAGHVRRRAGQLDRLGAAGAGACRGDHDRPPVPALPSVRPLVAARLARAIAGCGRSACRSGWRWGSRAGCSAPPPI